VTIEYVGTPRLGGEPLAFGPLHLSDVVAFTLPHNGALRRVMEKLGFTYEKRAPYKVFGEHVLYRRRCNPGDNRG
jgi:RimJ/RimL family protein N-acetyltransferase